MLMFLQDFHGELEKISLFFQRVQLLLIEVKPKLKKTYAALKKLKQGKGSNMARFAKECDGVTYKDIILNTAKQTRYKTQTRMEEFIEFAQAKKANEREAKANESEAKSEKKDQGVEIVQNQPNIAEAKNIAEPNAVPTVHSEC